MKMGIKKGLETSLSWQKYIWIQTLCKCGAMPKIEGAIEKFY